MKPAPRKKAAKAAGRKRLLQKKEKGKSDLRAYAPVVEAVHLVLDANQNEIVLGVHIKKPFLNRPDSIVHSTLKCAGGLKCAAKL